LKICASLNPCTVSTVGCSWSMAGAPQAVAPKRRFGATRRRAGRKKNGDACVLPPLAGLVSYSCHQRWIAGLFSSVPAGRQITIR